MSSNNAYSSTAKKSNMKPPYSHTTKPISSIHDKFGEINQTAFTTDGEYLFISSETHGGRNHLRKFPFDCHHQNEFCNKLENDIYFNGQFALSPKNDVIAVGNSKDIVIYDVITLKEITTMKNKIDGYVVDLIFDPFGQYLAVREDNGNLDIIQKTTNPEDWPIICKINLQSKVTHGLLFFTSNTTTYIMHAMLDLLCYDILSGKQVDVLEKLDKEHFECFINAICCTTHNWIIACSELNYICIWTTEGKLLHEIEDCDTHTWKTGRWQTQISVCESQCLFATGSVDGKIRVRSLPSLDLLGEFCFETKKLENPSYAVRMASLQFHPSGNCLISGHNWGEICCWGE
jgi:WD40 repeat protein